MAKREKPNNAQTLAQQVEKFFYRYRLDDPSTRRNLEKLGLRQEAEELEQIRQNMLRLQDICLRLRQLTAFAAREDVTDSARQVLQREADILVDEYNEIAKQTDFSATARLGEKLDKLGYYVQ